MTRASLFVHGRSLIWIADIIAFTLRAPGVCRDGVPGWERDRRHWMRQVGVEAQQS